MSRMTAAQVVSLGEYLNSDFDPASLTVSQLLGVLGYHNIVYPTPYSKSKLIKLFNDDIKAKATKWKKERLKKQNSLASDEGIIDGATGEPLRREPVTRSSRRISRVLPEQDDDPPSTQNRSELAKRRRSSVQPVIEAPIRKLLVPQESFAEESEPEEDSPPRKVGRSKKSSSAAGVRRISGPGEDSGWEDNNIFQSGAESSSPARPSPLRPKVVRRSLALRKSRKSASAPPEVQPTDSPAKVHVPPLSLPSTSFSPRLAPASPSHRFSSPQRIVVQPTTSSPLAGLRRSSKTVSAKQQSDHELDFPPPIPEEFQEHHLDFPLDTPSAEADMASDTFEEELMVTQGISFSGEDSPRPVRGGILTVVLRLLCLTFGGLACYLLVVYKLESASIGYCEAGTNTNYALERLRLQRAAVEECIRENRTYLYVPFLATNASADAQEDRELCPLVAIPRMLRPDRCTPCPEHARCTCFGVTCDAGYILRAHPFLFFLPPSASPRNNTFSLSASPAQVIWKVVSGVIDGLPGFGSVAFPPRCVEDPQRKRHIGALGKAVESMLGQERGRRLCSGRFDQSIKDEDGGEAKKWGYEIGELRDLVRKRAPPQLITTFDDTFNEAIQQLIRWGGVLIGEDQQNYRYVAHRTPDLTWGCVITVKSRELWQKWKGTVLGTVLMIIGLLYGRAKTAQKRRKSRRVAELVQIALDALRNQELAYHTDPATTAQPYLSSVQLRDLILQDEHSVSTRTRLWNQVERVVEGNANVRANVEEISGGDEMRVWRWVGGTGHRIGVKKEGPVDQGIDSQH